jgi:hypothetical protein
MPGNRGGIEDLRPAPQGCFDRASPEMNALANEGKKMTLVKHLCSLARSPHAPVELSWRPSGVPGFLISSPSPS